MKIDEGFEIEEYKGGEFAAQLTIRDEIFEDGYDHVTTKCFKTRAECVTSTKAFIINFNKQMEK